MSTSTPLFRVKQLDSVENVTDFTSAADHSLSLEKFQELRVAVSVPVSEDKLRMGTASKSAGFKSVFEEDVDFTAREGTRNDDKRWKFKGPWLARMAEGDFIAYLDRKVRPQRVQFRSLLRERLADELTSRQNAEAMANGTEAPVPITPQDVTEAQFTDYLRALRQDRAVLYALVSKFLDLAPLGRPVGVMGTGVFGLDNVKVPESPYGLAGPPPSHPSAGISYLRTGSYMENHPVYGPQARKTPVQSRVVHPRSGPTPARLGVGGFVATVPAGDNDFNVRMSRNRRVKPLAGIQHLDTTSYGGAKVYIEAATASVNPSGKIVLQTRETTPEAQLVAKENKGDAQIYKAKRSQKSDKPRGGSGRNDRIDRVVDEVLEDPARKNEPERDIVGSSKRYGLGPSQS